MKERREEKQIENHKEHLWGVAQKMLSGFEAPNLGLSLDLKSQELEGSASKGSKLSEEVSYSNEDKDFDPEF